MNDAAHHTQAAEPMPQLPSVGGEANAIAARTMELGQLLEEANLTIAFAESLTGGALSAELVRVPGISRSLMGSLVAYQLFAKAKLLGVDEELLAREGAVHPDVAVQMARGVRRVFAQEEQEVDIGVSTTGVAGPDAADGVPAGVVFVGISSLWGERAVRLDFTNLVRGDDPIGTRQRIRQATIEAAMFNVLEFLAKQSA